MGIYDREYLRPRRTFRLSIVLWIIIVTVGAYLVQGLVLGRGRTDLSLWFGVVPERVVEDFWVWQLVTHALLHAPGGLGHIFWNLLILYWLGTEVAATWGTRRFLALYVGGAAACGIAHTAVGYATGITGVPGIGASGAIMAVSVVAAFLFPRRTILFMFFLPMPLWVLVAIYVGSDLYMPLAGLRHWLTSAGHLGGALFGLVFHQVVTGARLLPARSRGRSRWRLRLPSRKPKAEEIDRILAKISSQGMSSLTRRERSQLQKASRSR